MDLSVLTTRELDTLGKRMHADGKFGADYAPMTKLQKIAYIAAEAGKMIPDAEVRASWVKELANSIIAGRDEGGAEFEDADNSSECDAPLVSQPDDKPPQEGEKAGGEFPGGFGFTAQPQTGEKGCTDENCRIDEGKACQTFEHKGQCPECEVPYVNAKHHTAQANGQPCPMEQKLDAHHQEGQPPKPDLSKMDLEAFIRAVTHDEHDPTFMEIGKAFNRAETIVKMVARVTEKAMADAETALGLVKETRRKKLTTATELTIKFPDLPPFDLKGKHPVIFPQVMALMALPDGVRQPVLLYGDAGGGKSTVAEQVADAFGFFPDRYGAVSCTGDMTKGAINGRILPIGEGKYIPADLGRLLETGKAFLYCWDEFDVAPGEIKIGANTMLAQGAIYVEERSFADLPVRMIVPSGTMFMACQNTINGPDAIYTSRSIPDGAANDRWIVLRMDSDPRVQASILGAPYTPLETWIPQQRTEDELRAELLVANTWLLQVKQDVKKKQIRRLVTDRAALRARALLTAGFTMDETKNVILAGWKPDELAMVGIGG